MCPAAALLNPQTSKPFFPFIFSAPPPPPVKLFSLQTFKFTRKLNSLSPPLHVQSTSFSVQNDGEDLDILEDRVIGDCVVFEEGIFEDPYLETQSNVTGTSNSGISGLKKPKSKKKVVPEVPAENLVPDKWKAIQAEINITKKERRRIAQEMEFNSRVEKRKKASAPIRTVNLEEYRAFREAKLEQLKTLIPDNPSSLNEEVEEDEERELRLSSAERVAPKNPRWAVYGRGFDDVTEFFSGGNYDAGTKKSEGPRKLFTKEEKVMLNRRIPDLSPATSTKWLPLHTLAASGEFYLASALLKHNVDINAIDPDGWTAMHKAIISKKQAITSFLLRESASPFVLDTDGATLMHYAVQTASSPAMKLLLLYNVDINLQDNDGWTPLHLAVQARRTDIVKLLLIKGADKTLRNKVTIY
uniref:Uncharacterized protein MANES_01G151300 n=1 Tax=Rhizophora mucronata TaxID=61149 RepID=A0A2P2ILT1_RHIMU